MKVGQLIEYPQKNIFLLKLCRKWGRETSFRPPFVFLKSFVLEKCKLSAGWFHYISIALKVAYNRNNWSRDMLNFDFLDKSLGVNSPAHFVYDFSTKMFLMLYSSNWPKFLEILDIMCIAIVCSPGCDVMDFEIKFIFLIESFFLHDEKLMTKT